jgi:hypothetical protein
MAKSKSKANVDVEENAEQFSDVNETEECEELPEGHVYAEKQEEVICVKCGKKCILDAEQAFCDACGEPLMGKDQEEKRKEIINKRRVQLEKRAGELELEIGYQKDLQEIIENSTIARLQHKYKAPLLQAIEQDKEKSEINKLSKPVYSINEFMALIEKELANIEAMETEYEKISEQLDNYQLEFDLEEKEEEEPTE